jgi:hypothetical protein
VRRKVDLPMAWRFVFSLHTGKDNHLQGAIACFKVSTGDIEDAPALDPLAKFEVLEKNGAVYIKGEESVIKANKRALNIKCAAIQGGEQVLVIGGYATVRQMPCILY